MIRKMHAGGLPIMAGSLLVVPDKVGQRLIKLGLGELQIDDTPMAQAVIHQPRKRRAGNQSRQQGRQPSRDDG